MQVFQYWCDVITWSSVCNKTSSCILCTLKRLQSQWQTRQCSVTVVTTRTYSSLQDEWLHSVHAEEVAELSVADQTVHRYSSNIVVYSTSWPDSADQTVHRYSSNIVVYSTSWPDSADQTVHRYSSSIVVYSTSWTSHGCLRQTRQCSVAVVKFNDNKCWD